MTKSIPVTKAVIAAAGRGTRFLPTVKAYAKELVPILSKPNIQYLVEEAIAAGITELCIVHRHGEKTIRNYFKANEDWETYLKSVNKLEALSSASPMAMLPPYWPPNLLSATILLSLCLVTI